MAISALASGIISSAANALFNSASKTASNTISNHKQWIYQSKQNAWNAQQATLAYNRQLDFWNKENEYNSPAQQIARLRAAGINPNLAYSNGGVQNVGAGSPSVSSSSQPLSGDYSGNYVSASSVGSDFINNYVKAEELKQIKAQTDKIQKENEYQGLENQIKAMTWYDEVRSKRHKYGSDSYLEDMAYEALQKARLDNNYNSVTFDSRVSQQLSRQTIEAFNEGIMRVNYAYANARLPYAEKSALNEFMTKVQNLSNLVSSGVLSRAQANAAYSDIKLNSELGKYYKAKSSESKQSRLHDIQSTKSLELSNTREAYQQSFDFDNPLFTEDGKFNFRGITDFVGGATGYYMDYKSLKSKNVKHGKKRVVNEYTNTNKGLRLRSRLEEVGESY